MTEDNKILPFDRDKNIKYKGWKIVRRINSGSFGTVYEIEREDDCQFKAALKVIDIPKSEDDLDQIKERIGKSEESLKKYCENMVSDIIKEFKLMYELKGISNIVSYEDHEIQRYRDGISWRIMIRMELLTSLNEYKQQCKMEREDVIRLGIDLCRALSICRSKKIIHRDIKPGNIFVSNEGTFKLGDFGIARVLEAHDEFLELSQIGTPNYIAPEVSSGKYSFSADIYSLGIVMYKLLNNDELPKKESRSKGEPLQAPCNDNTQLANIVLKACSFHPEDRYETPEEMQEELEKVLQDNRSNLEDWRTVKLEEPSKKPTKFFDALRKNNGVILKIAAMMLLIAVVFITVKGFSGGTGGTSGLVPTETSQSGRSGLYDLIDQRNFPSAYTQIKDRTEKGENMDEAIWYFVQECEKKADESTCKRAVAAMKLLTDNISNNENSYKETVQWFYDHDKTNLILDILTDLRSKGEEGEKLADTISLEYDKTD